MGELLRASRHSGLPAVSELLAAYKAVKIENGEFRLSVSGDGDHAIATDDETVLFVQTFLQKFRLKYAVERFDQAECDRRAAIARLNELSGGKLIIKK